jgi:hypothetical protein
MKMLAGLDEIARTEPFASFHRAWQEARQDDNIPHRGDINIQDFSPFMPNMIMYDYCGKYDIRYRLAGEAVSGRIGHVNAELNIFDALDPDISERSEKWWKGILKTPCGGVAVFSVAYPNGIHRACQIMKFPILGNDGRMMILALLNPVKILREEEPRETIRVGLDYSYGRYIDIGFGLPYGDDPLFVSQALKPMAE